MRVEERLPHVDRIDCDLVDRPWRFAIDQAEAIDRHWEERKRRTPELFNGRVLMLAEGAIEGGSGHPTVFRGAYTPVDFKAFLAWREFDVLREGVRNCFAMAAIETSDGAFVLGEMAPHTAPAGRIYFPSGTPDLHDVRHGKVDLEGSARRELREETGLTEADVVFGFGFTIVADRRGICCMKPVSVPQPAEVVVGRIHAFLAADPKPELARMHIVRSPADLVPAMPDFVVTYLKERFASR